MTWLRYLDGIGVADLPHVGYKAYFLGLLQQQQLPIVAGQVLTAHAWQTVVANLHWPDSFCLEALNTPALLALQEASQQVQRAFNAIHLPPSLLAELHQWPHPTWMLEASLWLDQPFEDYSMAGFEHLLPSQIGTAASAQLPQTLHHFWRQTLTARSLVVWQQYIPAIHNLPLATLITPLYPALAAGTLSIQGEVISVDAVLGLSIPLNQGEAIPARGRLHLAQPGTVAWENGFQEQIYQITTTSGHDGPDPSIGFSLQVTPRETPALAPPITADQLNHLIQLGQQAQAVLTQHEAQHLTEKFHTTGIHLEWMLCPHAAGNGWQLLITQAMPRVSATKAHDTPSQPPRSQRSRLTPPPLPAVSTVVQGIGASSGQAQGVAVVAAQPQNLPNPLPPNAIVVLPDLQPDVFLQLGSVAGIVTERGGATCHAAILAREIGVPAIVGAPQATHLLEGETQLWLDGDRGIVYGLAQDALPLHRAPIATIDSDRSAHQPSPTFWPEQSARYGSLRTKVMANLSQIRRLSTLPIDQIAGIGLLRSEWLLLDILEGRHPWHWVNQGQEAALQTRIVEQLATVLQVVGTKPLRYRSLDLRSHEWQALEGSPSLEPNPMLGLRGTLSYEVDARLFEVELAALATLQRAGYTNLQLILPFVRTVEEVLACQPLIKQAGLTDCDNFALWIMAEVPSVLFLLPAYAQAGVQGITIGSNDLTQLLLAVDRDQPTLASAYDERHPVVQMAMAHLIQSARRCGLTCSICGQAPVRHPHLIADLVAWGINSISVEAAALPYVLEAVWQAEQAEAELES